MTSQPRVYRESPDAYDVLLDGYRANKLKTPVFTQDFCDDSLWMKRRRAGISPPAVWLERWLPLPFFAPPDV